MLLCCIFDGSVLQLRLQEASAGCVCVFFKPKDLAAERCQGGKKTKKKKPAGLVTGMVYYLFGSILRVVINCRRENTM